MKVFSVFIFALLFFSLFSCKKDYQSTNLDSEIRDRYFNLEKIRSNSLICTQKVEDIDFITTEVHIQNYLLKNLVAEKNVDSLYGANKREYIPEFTFQHKEEKDLLTKRIYRDGLY